MAAIFSDRSDAGMRLARAVEGYRGSVTLVLAIPRGGVPVARRVADALGVPLDIVRTRQPRRSPQSAEHPSPEGRRRDLTGSRVIIVDDGVATGATARVACREARRLGAAEVVLAVPVAPPDWTSTLAGEADAFVAVATPHPFWSVGRWYTRFDGVTDGEVAAYLEGTDPELERSSAVPADLGVQFESAGERSENHTPGAQMVQNSQLESR